MTTSSFDHAARLHALHRRPTPLILPNAWDVASARIVEAAGAEAIATTSAGVAWSLGSPDGDELDRDRALDLIARIVAAVDVPVTADIESGFATGPEGVAETVRGVLAAGAVGVNLEDADHGGPAPLRSTAEQCARITAARRAADDAGVRLFLNARVDVYLRAVGPAEQRLTETLDRAAAYLAAGADGIFVPGLLDPETLATLTARLDAPLNVLVGPGAPTVAELGALGVARVSLGPSIAEAAYGLVRRAAEEVLATGSYTTLSGALDYSELNALLK